jgi:hypothetical protein
MEISEHEQSISDRASQEANYAKATAENNALARKRQGAGLFSRLWSDLVDTGHDFPALQTRLASARLSSRKAESLLPSLRIRHTFSTQQHGDTLMQAATALTRFAGIQCPVSSIAARLGRLKKHRQLGEAISECGVFAFLLILNFR